MIKKRIFEDKNYSAIWHNGKTIRIALDPKKSILELDYPEFYDIKITGKCEGNCPWCYMDSTCEEKHYNSIVDEVVNYFGGMSENERPFQVACIDENEMICGENGMVPIKDINIGDYVYDEKGNLKKVINKIISSKYVVKLTGNRGFSIICTPDHLFMDNNNNLISAAESLNKKLMISAFTDNCLISSIDLANYINETSRIDGKHGGSSGGIVTNDKVAFMHTLTPINRYLLLNQDIMWLYGITVAEGSRKGLSLNKNEKHLADRANEIYKNITKLKDANYYYNDNSLNVEFKEPKTFSTIFMKAMKIGFGSHNVSINFLYNLSLELIRAALRGMFDGDGCFRKRKDKKTNKYYFSLSYKTASKKLAKELVHILYTKFNVYASYYKGKNNLREIDGRKLPESDYYMIDIYGKKNIINIFPDLFSNDEDFKKCGTYKYSHSDRCEYIKIKDVEILNEKRNVIDITLENNSSHLFTVSHGIITHNCGGGEPTLHPSFIYLLEALKRMGIEPNYTTNGMNITQEIVDATKKYCGGVAVSCHPHLLPHWTRAANMFLKENIKLNFHIIISDKNSIDYFKHIYYEWCGKIDYFVLLPYTAQGRAEPRDIDWEYLVCSLPNDTKQIAFGAGFYKYLLRNDHGINVSLYEPEIMSKFLDLKDMSLYKSSFDLTKVN